jgi:hypothetical protein
MTAVFPSPAFPRDPRIKSGEESRGGQLQSLALDPRFCGGEGHKGCG